MRSGGTMTFESAADSQNGDLEAARITIYRKKAIFIADFSLLRITIGPL
jgi:hypothetical protein